MSGSPMTSPRLAALYAVLRNAKGPLSGVEIARRLLKRGQYTLALHSDIADLRRSPELAEKGIYIPPAECRVTSQGHRHYYYRLARRDAVNA